MPIVDNGSIYWQSCPALFFSHYMEHILQIILASLTLELSNQICPTETGTQWFFTCPTRKMPKSSGPSGAKPYYSGHTVRSAYTDRGNFHVLSWAEEPQEERKTYFCPNHRVMLKGAPWIAAPLINLSTFWPWTKWSPLLGLFHSHFHRASATVGKMCQFIFLKPLSLLIQMPPPAGRMC